ncbi:hypothetical protein HanPSC8_Chr17g0778981 [Helianthus annuus]|nr:hypothetical protein HanPSC8_Chr17g0778981 [Helianthus annuus]
MAWQHNNPSCMHINASLGLHVSRVSSTNSNCFPDWKSLHVKRSDLSAPSCLSVTFRPLTISKTKIPKLNTSAFTDKYPCIAYSGAMYPL